MSIFDRVPEPDPPTTKVKHQAPPLPPQDLPTESAVLGCVLLGGSAPLVTLLGDEGLKADHFYRPRHQQIFTTMVNLLNANEAVDAVTLSAALQRDGDLDKVGGEAYIHSLATMVPAAGNYRHYAHIVIDRARGRQLIDAARMIEAGVHAADPDLVAKGEALLSATRTIGQQTLTREEIQHQLFDFLDSGGGERWDWPFREIDDMTGGMRRQQLTILGGTRAMGKSALLDQSLELVQLTNRSLRCCAYLNEMSLLERHLRAFSRQADLSLKRVYDNKLTDRERQRFVKWIETVVSPQEVFEMRPCYGWSAEEIVRDIGRHRWDVVGVDLLNGIPHRDTSDIDHNVRTLRDAAGRYDCHIIATQHLNMERDKSTYPPEPVERDLRGSGQIADLAHNVMFVHLLEDKDLTGTANGLRGEQAVIKVTKARSGIPGRMDARFNGSRMRFEHPDAQNERLVA